MIFNISDVFVVTITTGGWLGYLLRLPQFKYLIILCISWISLLCWVILNFSCTRWPIIFLVCDDSLISKFPSPETNPDIQLGLGILLLVILGF